MAQLASPLTRPPLLFCAAICVGVCLSGIALKYFSAPWVFIAFYCTSAFVFCWLCTDSSLANGMFFNLAFLSFILGCLEIYSYFTKTPMPQYEGDAYRTKYMIPNDTLGYGPIAGAIVEARKVLGPRLIYRVTYTIGENGLRITPEDGDNRCILFFGDSFTFGEGVEDQQSMPYIVAELSKRKTYNFGFHGYGPHQMLSAIEHGLVDRIVDCEPHWVIYSALPQHVARSAGYWLWDEHGPKYVVENGHAQYVGHFDDQNSELDEIQRKIMNQVGKSYM
jgi:hypothetical protein